MSNTSSNYFGKVVMSWCCNGLADQTTIIQPAATLLAAALAIAYYAWWFKKYFTKKGPPLPPGPLGLPILGNLPFLEPDLHIYFSKLSKTYGPIFKLQLGRKICIVIGSPSLASDVLRDNDAIVSDRDTPATALVGTYGGFDLAWGPTGPEWRKLRKLFVQELMHKTSLDASYALRRRQVRETVTYVHGKVGSPVNIGDQTFVTTLNVMISMLWGGSLVGEERGGFGIEFRQLVMEYVELLGLPNLSDLFPLLARFDLQGYESRMRKVVKRFDDILESVIAQRKKLNAVDGADVEDKKKEESKDFLQLMLELNQQGDEKTSLSMNEIKGLFVDMVVAGTDTTAVTIEWAMSELLGNPDKLKKAVEELDKVVGDQTMVEESHLAQLPYLDAVVKETLRLHPPVPLLATRRPNKTFTVAGYSIPKASRLLFNAWAIQRDPEFWEHPLKFEPERFLEDTVKGNYLGQNFHFFPFGSGRRICPGIPIAERMAAHVLAALLHSFDWKLPEGTKPDMQEKFGIALKKMNPLVVIPVARSSNLELYQ